ncbi:NAD(P)-dependent dehydrogenase, short-chain alcohol dehydrogenase family [Robiginitalea myxolifaciens]|uniref:NAD(P)-dependent dehydrogenase, short-chain alcohol dehydrogenase family n=1 Tax=Robiginitalea myxolifaciens TaxID=400055 RepID=A0A1I6GCS3_9FLAO|nr:SDR family oxidoreductase [Robiginitalea myxolifaciens]SFR39931.1 NAD(P)-dependent dehydrogenase, short-chain alcohol dehydrogenase family [Robiginitalea myxolifaciens]
MEKSDRIVLVTGGSRGLGRDMAISLAAKGFHVVLTYQGNASKAAEVVSEIESQDRIGAALQLDVSDAASFGDFAKTLKETLSSKFPSAKIFGLVNNAGTGYHATFEATADEGFQAMFDIHLKGPFFLTQILLPMMENGGSIVNISSGLTRFTFPGYAAYASMKGGIEVLTHYLAKELGQRKIRANTVAPGAIETDFGGGAVRDNKELNAMISSLTALGRVGLPDDIGGVVAFLCNDDSKWINAQRIEVSGGSLI